MHPTQSHTPPEWITTREAADRIAVSIRTLHRYVAAGLITPHRLPSGVLRFDTSEVDALLSRREGEHL